MSTATVASLRRAVGDVRRGNVRANEGSALARSAKTRLLSTLRSSGRSEYLMRCRAAMLAAARAVAGSGDAVAVT